ncbi:transmembrane protein 100-like [Sardina pilchardus]|uniref:transmembrane protein 100-like n=1 Tax=Sardina pilchardus TaxID=27697 RepID=UPI002E0D4873
MSQVSLCPSLGVENNSTMATPDGSEMVAPFPAVTYDSKSETVTLPGGIVSVAGITVVTGGAELTCGSCTLAIAIWGTLIGVSVVAVGLWDHSQHARTSASLLLTLGLVVLSVSFAMVASVVGVRLWSCKTGRAEERDEGKVVLVGERGRSVIKTVTV